MHPIRQTLRLSQGTVTVQAWGADVIDAHLTDLLTLTATLGHVRAHWASIQRGDVEPQVWGAFWRLVRSSVPQGLPDRLSWGDRLLLLESMWDLNDVEATEGKLTALAQRASALQRQGHPTAPSMSS